MFAERMHNKILLSGIQHLSWIAASLTRIAVVLWGLFLGLVVFYPSSENTRVSTAFRRLQLWLNCTVRFSGNRHSRGHASIRLSHPLRPLTLRKYFAVPSAERRAEPQTAAGSRGMYGGLMHGKTAPCLHGMTNSDACRASEARFLVA